MQQKLREYLDQAFAKAPKTRRVLELKEELLANLNDKYQDMIARGRGEQESFDSAVRSIGDVDELLSRITDEQVEPPESRKKTALVVAGCVGAYIVAVISIILLNELGVPEPFPLVAFLSLCGLATCVLVYHYLSKPNYVKQDDTMVEEFIRWHSSNNQSKEVYDTLSTVLWLMTVALYFIVSFAFHAWAFSWVIFILGAAVQNIVKLVMKRPGK